MPATNIGHFLQTNAEYELRQASASLSSSSRAVFEGATPLSINIIFNLVSFSIGSALYFFMFAYQLNNWSFQKYSKRLYKKIFKKSETPHNKSGSNDGNECNAVLDEIEDPIVTIENLTKSYGNHVVIEGMNLKIAKNCTTILLGNNGSGKSTLM